MRFVFIGSTDLGKAYRLYRQDASDIVSATQAALNAKSAGKDVRVVSTLDELEAELAAARSDKVVPVVFFHNAEQRVAIGDGVTFEEFSARFGHEAVPLTCSSFESPFGFVTTDRLDVGASVYAANAALAKADASGTGLRGFLSGFQEAYEAEMARKYRVRASGVAVLTVVGVAVVLNVAFGDDDDKEKKK